MKEHRFGGYRISRATAAGVKPLSVEKVIELFSRVKNEKKEKEDPVQR